MFGSSPRAAPAPPRRRTVGATRHPLLATLAAGAALAALPAGAQAAGSTAPAQVFFPNPVQSLQDESLTDMKDRDFFSADPLLRTAYTPVTLTDLDGSGTLTGTYAEGRLRDRDARAPAAS